ncbi:HEXXH motif domain-containing protein [Streptomyces sp. ME19-01-6]|uniref:HEXXH motif domain-containing protein n=1 Tax=Streptomyces sp. ME19-01-6 TaxID=3028686 RepID=UPI0029ACA6E7|nr:HEXXH motif domain-containing protein [Streptomyces sp. ME19-01-6]MDX3228950.1 HEXXH motif domain-containing protein [Streptomyces sp. ME19-01-6]
MSRHHRLSTACFEELAHGGGGVSAIAELRAGQRSRLMLLLRALTDLASSHPGVPGPLPAPREAWELLIRAERRSPSSVARLLLHPQVGAWLSRCVRRLRGVAQETADEVPLWLETGYLHTVAASAALLAGIDFRIAVGVRDGGVMLPALGFAELAGCGSPVAEIAADGAGARTVRAGSRTVPLPSDLTRDAAKGWQPLRRLHGHHPVHPCSPYLDDLDPYRDFLRPTAPTRLSEPEAERWQKHFDSAWALVAGQSSVDPTGVAGCLISVVPVRYPARVEPFSASSPEAYGCVLLNPPTDSATLAASLIHEAQHVKLSALLDLVPLMHGGMEEIHYAPWRTDPRPLRGLLHGVYAFLGVTAFWQSHRHVVADETTRAVSEFEFALRRTQTAQGLRTLRDHAELTALGDRFLRGIRNRLSPWLTEPVPEVPLRTAEDLNLDHRLLYRLHHLSVDPGRTGQWARAWQLGRPAPDSLPPTVLRASRTAVAARPALIRLRLRDPAGFALLREKPEGHMLDGMDAPLRADLDWAAGDTAAALRGYRDRLAEHPDDLPAWSGLALTLPAGPAKEALLGCPEVVLAVHRALRDPAGGPDPVALARWIGTRR